MKTIAIAISSILAILGAVLAFFKITQKPLPGFLASKLAGSEFGIKVLTFFNTPVPPPPVVPTVLQPIPGITPGVMTPEMAAAAAAIPAAIPATIPATIGGKKRKRKTRKKKN